jgi:hypothetical protein
MCLNETYNKVRTGKNVSFISYSEWYERWRCFIAIAFQLCFGIAIKKVHGNEKGFEFNGTHQLLAHPDDVHILYKKISTIKKKWKLYYRLVERLV